MTGRAFGIGRDLPYRVLIVVPAGAVRPCSDHMHEFCRACELAYRAHKLSQQKPGVWDYVIWCFANPMRAQAFHRQIGGERITVTEEFRERDRGSFDCRRRYFLVRRLLRGVASGLQAK
jgi:hypothetical protein